MKKIVIFLLAISVLFIGCTKNEKVKEDKNVEVSKESEVQKNDREKKYVKVEKVKKQNFIKKLLLPGVIKPNKNVMITSKINGTIDKIRVDIGSKVEEGELLAKIDDTMYKLQYQSAKTAVDNSKLTLSRLSNFEDNSDMKHQSIQMAETQYETSSLNYDIARNSYNRAKKLYETDAISKSEFEQIENNYKLAEESLESAKESLKQAKRNYEYDLKATKIALKAAQNSFEQAKENLNYTNITSPISGVVSSKNISEGENISPGTPLFNVVSLDSLYIEAGVSEKDITKVQTGQKVIVKVDVLGDKKIEGVICGIGPVPNKQSNTYPIKVKVEKNLDGIKSDMYATVEILTGNKKDSLAISKKAIIKEASRNYVFIEKDGKAIKKKIELGLSNDKYYEVIKGLDEKDKVIVVGNKNIKDGDMIIVRK